MQCTPLQLFYRISDQAWIAAYKLKTGDKLLCANNKTITVSNIEIINQTIDVYTLEIKNTHIFLVTKDSIVAHNMLMACGSAATIFVLPAEIGCGATIGSALGPIGTCAGVVISSIIGVIVHTCIKERLIEYGICYGSQEILKFENFSKKEVENGSDLPILSTPHINSKPAKTVEDILQDSSPGEETKGRATQYVKSGGYKAAVKDFDDLQPTNIKKLPNGEGKIGTLPDGRTIIAREKSKEGRPTLEIQRFNDKGKIVKIIKIRYER